MDEQIQYLSQVLSHLLESLGAALPGVIAGLVVITAFLLAARISRRLLRRLAGQVDSDNRPLVALAGEAARYALAVIGLITGLGTMGIDVSALIAGLGLTGFALGFALRDAVSNLIAGVLILLYRPFQFGDRITVGGNSGTVVAINFRYTELDAEGPSIVLVPNSAMFSNSVKVEPAATPAPGGSAQKF
jgi:small-conductance mechanosensitive channel